MSQFMKQLRVLMRKNALIKWRHKVILLLELVIPVLFILGLDGIKFLVKPTTISANIPSDYFYSTSFDQLYEQQLSQLNCQNGNLVWECAQVQCSNSYEQISTPCYPKRIAIAPFDSSSSSAVEAAQSFISWANVVSLHARNYSTFQYFDSQQSVVAALTESQYCTTSPVHISSAIIFNAGYPNYDYTLRMNKSIGAKDNHCVTMSYGWEHAYPPTTGSNIDITQKSGAQSNQGPEPYASTYTNTGTFALTEIVNSFIATQACYQTESRCGLHGHMATQYFSLRMEGVASFPNEEVKSLGFWSTIGFVFALLIVISVIFPVANVIKSLVQEKESRMREVMLMMALRSDVLWISWGLNHLFLFAPMAVMLTFAGKSLFQYSDYLFVFVYFFFFFLASVSYCIFMSMFFSTARTASIIGSVMYFAGYFVYVGLQFSSSAQSRLTVLAACLHPVTAFTFGTLAFQEYEDANIGVTFNTWATTQSQPITFQETLIMLLIDTGYLAVLACYVNCVWPTEYGTTLPWYFPLNPWFWWRLLKKGVCNSCCAVVYKPLAQEDRFEDHLGQLEPVNSYVEPVSDVLKAQINANGCVDIKLLQKSFNTRTGQKVAVDGLNLTIYNGQITALLGHNGAGKTTTISILTGLIPADSGSALIQGLDIGTDMHEIRQQLGVCPQHDVLYAELTVEEHLYMFANFKGTGGQGTGGVKAEVEKMIVAVGLTEKRKVFASQLSGGQKRKLSVGLAFIGGSKVVFLDEPTSGMDPYSRRFTWDLIRQHKEGRCVVLTTHFMDEADLLGDRIAIMSAGQLRCCGSSLYLKKTFGVGYNMTIEKQDVRSFRDKQVIQTIVDVVPECKVITNVGTELTVQLPFHCSGSFSRLFEQLEISQESLGIQSYGISVTTLEEVFIKVASALSATPAHNSFQPPSSSSSPVLVAQAVQPTISPVTAAAGAVMTNNWFETPLGSSQSLDHETNIASVEQGHAQQPSLAVAADINKLSESSWFTTFWKQCHALLVKRCVYFARDTKAWMFQYVMPVLLLFVAMMIMKYSFPSTYQPLKLMNPHMYNADISTDYMPTLYMDSYEFCYPANQWGPQWCSNVSVSQSSIMNNVADSANFPVIPLKNAKSIEDVSVELLARRLDYQASQIGAISIRQLQTNWNQSLNLNYIVHANYTAVHASPLYNVIFADAVVRTINPNVSISMSLYPLPDTACEVKSYANTNSSFVVMIVMALISFIPASFATFVVRERETKTKYQQLVSGMSVQAYWITNWTWDALTYQPTALAFVLLIWQLSTNKVLSSDSAILPVIGLLCLFGGAVPGFIYLFSFCFSSSASAQIGAIVCVFTSGLLLGNLGNALRIIPTTSAGFMAYGRYILALLPPFALGNGLYNLAWIDVYSQMELPEGQSYSPLDWNITGMNLLFLGVECVVYLLLTILYEHASNLPCLSCLNCGSPAVPTASSSSTSSCCCCCCSTGNAAHVSNLHQHVSSTSAVAVAALKDSDVLAEEQRVSTADVSNMHDARDRILVRDVKKVYQTGKYAVKGLSFGIPNGECFGLLGVNGAGKSTTLSMLTGEISPSSGEVSLGGMNVLTDVHRCRRHIGLCPQYDALFENLTAREHLYLYARVKGILEKDVAGAVEQKIKQLSLGEYADRTAGGYSGGNKRKLSVAIAMIGDPSILFLDEPSTGMDPVARRGMWQVISDTVTCRQTCSLILTTHSMEECEALCTRIGIMVGGVMRCLGSAQRLRSNYGLGYQIEIKIDMPSRGSVLALGSAIIQAIEGGSKSNMSADAGDSADWPAGDATVTAQQIMRAFTALNKPVWSKLLSAAVNENELQSLLDANNKAISIKQLAVWWLVEECVERLLHFLHQTFGGFFLRERQSAKIRVELKAASGTASSLKLSRIFGAIELNRVHLSIAEYSISQTSLEQIFNHFAAQQEEESVVAACILRGAHEEVQFFAADVTVTGTGSEAEVRSGGPVTHGNHSNIITSTSHTEQDSVRFVTVSAHQTNTLLLVTAARRTEILSRLKANNIHTLGDLFGPTGAKLTALGQTRFFNKTGFEAGHPVGKFLQSFEECVNVPGLAVTTLEQRFNMYTSDAVELFEFLASYYGIKILE